MSTPTKHLVTFLPGQRSAYFESGITLRDAALAVGILIESNCAGIGSCGRCRVRVNQGAGPVTPVEKKILSGVELDSGFRLSCQAVVADTCLCEVPAESQISGEQILDDGLSEIEEGQSEIRLVELRLPLPAVGERTFLVKVLEHELEKGGNRASCSLAAARQLGSHEIEQPLTVLMDGSSVLFVERSQADGRFLGAAIDVGTTTVVTRLLDLRSGRLCGTASSLNLQRAHGADVVSRIRFCQERAGGLGILQELVLKAVNQQLRDLCSQLGVTPERIFKCTVVGNTVMQHLMLGVDPRSVAFAPYVPPLRGPVLVNGRELGLEMNRAGTVYFMPNLASFVGSDLTGVLTALNLAAGKGTQLVVDVGTNGEMILCGAGRTVCASSPAGPAWEGATISSGMIAARGAVERVDIADGDLQYRTIGGERPFGICGSGLIDLVACLRRTGVINRQGRIMAPAELPAGLPPAIASRVYSGADGARAFRLAKTDQQKWIEVTQKDIREVQLAKAAISTGIRILLKEVGIRPGELERILVAGGFGNHLRGEDAIELGLLPDVPVSRIRFVGNAAVMGAQAVLLSGEARLKAERIADTIEYVEVSGRSDFQEVFVDAMQFP